MRVRYRIPIIFFSQERAFFFARRFRSPAARLAGSMPNLKRDLMEAGMVNLSPTDFVSVAMFISLFLFVLLVVLFGLIGFVAFNKGILNLQTVYIFLLTAVLVPLFYFIYFIEYPKLEGGRRRAQIETQLIFATRELMVKLRSGVPIFNALLDVALGDYGLVSSEFKLAVEEIESGISQETALDNLSKRVPSQSFKRMVDIMLNAMRSGSDLAATLDTINDMLVKKQQSDMQAYAGELTPLSMGYMLIAVVVPSLGMSVFLILGSMARLNVSLVIYIIPPMLIVFEVLFIGLVKSRRPAVGV
ncbi:MAG: type II secretion system F family protein [Candidatus Parvarchaeota archaeon]|nr:type II secretion system F family protein [Candidatus Parvarchaeota archaeon]